MRFAEYVAQLNRLHADVGKSLELAPSASALAVDATMIASDPEELLRAYGSWQPLTATAR